MNSYLSLGISVAVSGVGQLLFKAGALRAPHGTPMLLNPWVLAGFGAYFVGALFYVNALRTIPLSIAFPSVSAGYVLVALASHFVWAEPFGARHAISLGLISVGIVTLANAG